MIEHHCTCPRHPTAERRRPDIFAELGAAKARVPPISGVTFLPWVGEGYGKENLFGVLRVLVVGESHYEWCNRCWTDSAPRDPDLTGYVVSERLSLIGLSGQLQHWGKLENAFLGLEASAIERREFWHSVGYYNFLQRVVGLGPRVRVSRELWADAESSFIQVLQALVPNLIVVAGRRVWAHLPSPEARESTLEAGGKLLERCRYVVGPERYALAAGVAHPSRGLGSTWYPVVHEALNQCARQ